MYSGSGDLPKHIYCYVNSAIIREKGEGYEPCVWFAIHSHPGRMWGCHIMLECGAVYRNVPPHHLAFSPNPDAWTQHDAQIWNCYGSQFSTIEYTFLSGMKVQTKSRGSGNYLFTAIPLNDGFSAAPEQSKEFMFCEMESRRLAILPTNMLLFEDKSFGEVEWPTDLKTLSHIWSVE
jgi:hypothetical protein